MDFTDVFERLFTGKHFISDAEFEEALESFKKVYIFFSLTNDLANRLSFCSKACYLSSNANRGSSKSFIKARTVYLFCILL